MFKKTKIFPFEKGKSKEIKAKTIKEGKNIVKTNDAQICCMTKISQMPFHYIYLKSLYILFYFISFWMYYISLKIYGSWNDGWRELYIPCRNCHKMKVYIFRYYTSFSYLVKLYRKEEMVLEFDCFLNMVYR